MVKSKLESDFQVKPYHKEYKEHYMLEDKKRNELNSAIDRPIGIIVIYAGIIYYLANNISILGSCLGILQIALITVAVIILFWAIWNIIRSYIGREYGYYATPEENDKYHKKLLKFHDDNDEAATKDLMNSIYESYAEAATINAGINEQRSDHLYKAKISLVWTFPIIVLAGIVQLIANFV